MNEKLASPARAVWRDPEGMAEIAVERKQMLIRASEEYYPQPVVLHRNISAPSLRSRNQRQRRRDDRRVRSQRRKGERR